jgi:hypothetical protein
MKITENLNDEKVTITATYKGDKSWDADSTVQNCNNHRVTVSRRGKRVSFEFWGSIVEPEIKTRNQLRFAVACFLFDAAAGRLSFEDFCSDYGYNEDSRKAFAKWKECKNATKKADRIFSRYEQEKLLAEWQ